MAYDESNIFARILRGEIPARKVYEDEYALAFHDITPKAPVHVLVLPKGEFETLHDFGANASPELAAGLWNAVAKVAELTGIAKTGYRTIINTGPDGGQEVGHVHIHILGGRPIGRMVSGQPE